MSKFCGKVRVGDVVEDIENNVYLRIRSFLLSADATYVLATRMPFLNDRSRLHSYLLVPHVIDSDEAFDSLIGLESVRKVHWFRDFQQPGCVVIDWFLLSTSWKYHNVELLMSSLLDNGTLERHVQQHVLQLKYPIREKEKKAKKRRQGNGEPQNQVGEQDEVFETLTETEIESIEIHQMMDADNDNYGNEGEFTVEAILERRINHDGVAEALVQFAGYEAPEWIVDDFGNLDNAQQAVDDYENIVFTDSESENSQ